MQHDQQAVHDFAQVVRLGCVLLLLIISPASGTEAQSAALNARRQSDVIYGRKFGMALTMEVFTPLTRNGRGVLWVVSSSGTSTREQTFQESFERRIVPLLDRGYTVFAVIHGSAPLFNLQDQLSDIRRAVRFVRHQATEFGIDGDRLGIAGSSAGGLLALMVAMQGDNGNAVCQDLVERASDRVQAVGVFFAPTDLMNYGASRQDIVDLMRHRDGRVDPSFEFYTIDAKTGERRPVSSPQDILAMLRELSPITHVTSDDPPTILIHGDADAAVPIQQSRELDERLRAMKVPSHLVVREGMKHAYPGWESDVRLIADWFDQHLRSVR